MRNGRTAVPPYDKRNSAYRSTNMSCEHNSPIWTVALNILLFQRKVSMAASHAIIASFVSCYTDNGLYEISVFDPTHPNYALSRIQ